MPTIPDLPHRDQKSLDELRRRYPGWEIAFRPARLPIFTAELRTHGGRSIHFLAGHSLDELTARLATATAAPGALIVPSCPKCRAPLSEITWLGGAPPHGAGTGAAPDAGIPGSRRPPGASRDPLARPPRRRHGPQVQRTVPPSLMRPGAGKITGEGPLRYLRPPGR